MSQQPQEVLTFTSSVFAGKDPETEAWSCLPLHRGLIMEPGSAQELALNPLFELPCSQSAAVSLPSSLCQPPSYFPGLLICTFCVGRIGYHVVSVPGFFPLA